jgi:hypothetical protein
MPIHQRVVEWHGRIGIGDEVTLDKAAELLDTTPNVVAALVRECVLPARTNGPHTSISLADIEVYRLQSQSRADSPTQIDRHRRANRHLLG